MPLSRLVAIPFALAFGFILYWLLTGGDENYSWTLIPFGLVLVSIYVFHHQINAWGYKRRPPKLNESIVRLYMMHIPFLSKLDKEELDAFFSRTSMWVELKEFLVQALDGFPDDVKYMLAAFPILLTLHKEDYSLSPFDRYVVYPHPFLSPQFQDDVHIVEHEEKDGVLVFSLEQFLPAFIQKGRYYNAVLHEFGKIFKKSFPYLKYPKNDDISWDEIDKISPFSRIKIQNLIGLEQNDKWPVLVHHYFYYNDKLKALQPRIHAEMGKIFGYKF